MSMGDVWPMAAYWWTNNNINININNNNNNMHKTLGCYRGQVCPALAYKLAATWCRPTFMQMTRVDSCSGFAMIIAL